MLFNSLDFLVFFPVVVLVYFVIPRRARQLWLLAASYYFYMSWSARYALLIGGSTLITYLSGLLLEKSSRQGSRRGQRLKKLILCLCLAINLGILFLFKYGNFAIDSLNTVLGWLHITVIERRFNFLLPVGISFYTFQALGYSIDVYRGDIKAEKNLLYYALFVSFFPQLVAGPIERSANLLPQMRNADKLNIWNARRVASGAILMVWGLFMKMVIADRVALVVDTVFDEYRMFGSAELLFAAVGFSIQIYCDFASYSTIAVGAARVMGFELMENFNTPYFARDIRDFWNRWHISLSTWFKDYLYIPLGGNRKGKRRKALNLMAVFLVSGLWHGASWNFVVWGGLHGLYQVVADATRPYRRRIAEKLKLKTDCLSWRLGQTFVTFGLVTFAWVFFRSDTVTDALRFFMRILVKPTPWLLFNGGLYNLGLDRVEMNVLLVSLGILLLVDLVRYLKKQTLDTFLFAQNLWFEWGVVIALIAMIFIYGEYGPAFDPQQFIYFQF